MDTRLDSVSLCPDRVHHVYAAVEAAEGLQNLSREERAQVIRRLCDIAEIAFLSIDDHWDEAKLLRLSAGKAEVFYSVDANGVLVHQVVESRVA